MELKDLFVNHKQVDPVVFNKPHIELPKPIYLNRDRAQQVTSSESTDTFDWNADREYDEIHYDWDADREYDNKYVYPWVVKYISKNNNENNSDSEIIGTVVNKWSNPYIDKNTWIQDMTKAYKKLGLNDNSIKNLIAKNALESAWGKSAQGAFNFGNITVGKYWTGNYVEGKDTDAEGNKIIQKFRSYNSLDDYVKDEIDFLTKLYDFNQNDNIDVFLGKLQGNNSGKRKYAEAKDYITKVKAVYNSI